MTGGQVMSAVQAPPIERSEPSRLSGRPPPLLPGGGLRGDLATVALLAGCFAFLHLVVAGPVPSGPDGGNWLALARGVLGETVKSAEVGYPPVFLVLLAGLLSLATPLAALTMSAILAKAVLVAAAYWVGRPAGRLAAAVVAILIGTAGYQLEAYAWGAYPQLLATGIALLTTYAALRYLAMPRLGGLLLVAVGTMATFGTHKLAGGLLMLAVPSAVALGWVVVSRTRRGWLVPGLAITAVLLPALPFLVSWTSEARAGVEPVINPLGLSVATMVANSFREAPITWIAVALSSVSGVALLRRNPASLGLPITLGAGWAAAGLASFLALGEQRSLLALQIGGLILAVVGFRRLEHLVAGRVPEAARKIVLVGGSALAAWLLISGVSSYVVATSWYRVVDREEIALLGRLEEISRPTDLVLASRSRHGNPLGWWVEGYTARPAYTAIDLRYLAFPEERHQARQANAVFDDSATPTEVAARLVGIPARFVIVDRRGPDADWLARAGGTRLTVVIDSASLVVLEVS